MMPKAKKTNEPDAKQLLIDLKKQIGMCTMMCTSNTEFNALAFMLASRAIDILETMHGEDFYRPLAMIVHDRQLRHRVPTTVEYARNQAAIRKFLP